ADARGVPMAYLLAYTTADRDPARFAPALEQSQGWKGARSAVERSRATLYLSDTPGLQRAERLDLFLRVLRVVVVQLPVLAIHWHASQRFVDPAVVAAKPGPLALHEGPVNVRMFNVANGAPGEILMDTCGMAAFGLPDAQ